MVAYFYPPRLVPRAARGMKGHEDFIDAFRRGAARAGGGVGVVVGGPGGRGRCLRGAAPRTLPRIACGTASASPVCAPTSRRCIAISTSPSTLRSPRTAAGPSSRSRRACPTVATAVGGLPDVVDRGTHRLARAAARSRALAAAIADGAGRSAGGAAGARARDKGSCTRCSTSSGPRGRCSASIVRCSTRRPRRLRGSRRERTHDEAPPRRRRRGSPARRDGAAAAAGDAGGALLDGRACPLPAGAGRARGARLHAAQVPHHACRRRRRHARA